MELEVTSSLTSYGSEYEDLILGGDALNSLKGRDFGNIETGETSDILFYYFRHSGTEAIYNVGIYLRTVGTDWGGYCEDYDNSKLPYNPNIFKNGGVNENGYPMTSTADYEFMRTVAYNNPEMGVRLHQDRENIMVKDDALGYKNKGLSFSDISLKTTTLDYTKTSDSQIEGLIYPEPIDSSKKGQAGDEAKLGISIRLPEETEGAGYIQFAIAIKYRYTA
jgi:hypothetical protein